MPEHDERVRKAVEELDGLPVADEEEAHIRADAILIESAPPEVREAYRRVQERAGSWWYA
jgi:hypothetical protein